MSIPLFALLIIYGVLALAALGLGFLKSIALFGYGGSFAGFLATAVFWGGCAIVLLATWSMLAGVDWSAPLIDLSNFSSAPLGV